MCTEPQCMLSFVAFSSPQGLASHMHREHSIMPGRARPGLASCFCMIILDLGRSRSIVQEHASHLMLQGVHRRIKHCLWGCQHYCVA